MGWNAGGFGSMTFPSTAAVVLGTLVACSSPRPVAEPVAPVRLANHCAAVADRLLAIFSEIRHHAPAPAMAAAYREVVVERCTQDVWSVAAQDCIVAPAADVDACTRLLAPEQAGSFAEAVQARLNAAGAASTP